VIKNVREKKPERGTGKFRDETISGGKGGEGKTKKRP